jgi:DHA2 family multidrug resistance protein
MLMVGAASFSTTVLMPQFLQSLVGYTAESAGMVLSAAAMILLIELPLVGQLTSRIQARYLMAFGWATLAAAMFFSTRRIDLQISFASATWLRIAQYVPMGFIFIPATMVAYSDCLKRRVTQSLASSTLCGIWAVALALQP